MEIGWRTMTPSRSILILILITCLLKITPFLLGPSCSPPPIPRLMERDNRNLCMPVSCYEVRQAVLISMKPLKALGPDGFQPIFHQKYWDIVASSVFQFTKKCFNTWEFHANLNKCLITLILKIDNPEKILHFRLITLCNVSYKTVSKIIVNRMRPLLEKIVGPNQASFFPGRQTIDNVIVNQETIHTLENSKKKKGGLVFKINLEKACNKILWKFLERDILNFKLNNN